MSVLLTAAGWVGGLLMVLAYGLVTLRHLRSTGIVFQLLNTLGAVLLIGSAVDAGAFPNAVISIAWAAIGLYGMCRPRIESADEGECESGRDGSSGPWNDASDFDPPRTKPCLSGSK